MSDIYSRLIEIKANEAAKSVISRDLMEPEHGDINYPQYEGVSEMINCVDFFDEVFFKGEDFKDFHEWAEHRRKEGKSVNCLDLLGPGRYIDNYDNMVAVTLTDRRTPEEVTAGNIEVVPVDFYSNDLTSEVDTAKAKLGVDRFDMIVCRPAMTFLHNQGNEALGGKMSYEEKQTYMVLYYQKLQEAYKMLSEDGVMLVQLPTWIHKDDEPLDKIYNGLHTSLNNVGVEADIEKKRFNKVTGDMTEIEFPEKEFYYDVFTLKIEKNEHSPDELPDNIMLLKYLEG